MLGTQRSYRGVLPTDQAPPGRLGKRSATVDVANSPDTSFDITTAAGRRGLAERHVSNSRDDTLTAPQITTGLESLVSYLGAQPWTIWRWGGFNVPTGSKSTRLTDTGQAAQLGLDLAAVAHCEGFRDLLKGFGNPTQFDDSMFEAQMARWCIQRRAVKSLRFGPEYVVRGHVKHPDFEIQTPIGRIVCECKRLHHSGGDFSARLARVTTAFDAAIKTLDVPESVRVEVEVQERIAGDLHRSAIDACAAAMATPIGEPVRRGPFLVLRSEVGKPPVHQTDGEVQTGRVRVGATPTGITAECTYLLVSSPWMERALVRAMGGLANTALRQLPEHHQAVIFVAGSRRHGKAAAASRLTDPAYAHCIAIATVHSGNIDLARRDIDVDAIEWIFLDKAPSRIGRLRLALWWRMGLRAASVQRSFRYRRHVD